MKVRIIRPASREQQDLLGPRLPELQAMGWHVAYDDLPRDPSWAYTSSTRDMRVNSLMDALTSDADFVVAARGGYGASDLLEHMDFALLARSTPKTLVGFSDISAIHSALYTKLNWPGLHAPMPATTLWRLPSDDGSTPPDLIALQRVMKGLKSHSFIEEEIPVQKIGVAVNTPLSGRLFGGCFSVLTNLIGTPYFPKSLAGHIVFIEDLDEHPGRLMRYLQQWRLSGALEGVSALVIGTLKKLGESIPDNASFVLERFAASAGVPVFHSTAFGHCTPNFPLLIGALATLDQQTLSWTHGGTLS